MLKLICYNVDILNKLKGVYIMELAKVNGNTYFINTATNVGVYAFKDKYCLLVDTGINNSQSKKIDDVLKGNNLRVKYIINTHSHMDHCGGNLYFQNNYPGSIVYSSKGEKIYIENPELKETILFSSKPIKDLDAVNKSFIVDYILDDGVNKIDNEKFEIIPLKGHSVDQIGIITGDRVCFLGDGIFSESIMNKYSLPYLFDIGESIKTLEFIKNIDADYFIPGHAERVLNKEETIALADKNMENIAESSKQIVELLEQPLTREELLENLIIINDLPLRFKQYFIYLSSISAFLTYLRGKDIIESSLENGKLYFYRNPAKQVQ
mgnify:CR=1 FL=1